MTMMHHDPSLVRILYDKHKAFGAIERVGDGKWMACLGEMVDGRFRAKWRVRHPLLCGEMHGYWYSEATAEAALRAEHENPTDSRKTVEPIPDRSLWGGNA